MSKDTSTASRLVGPRNTNNVESKENEFENSFTAAQFPPPRAPLYAIPDPSQYQKEAHEGDFDLKGKYDATRLRSQSFDKRNEASESRVVMSIHSTSKLSSRHGKAHSEPSSAQSTPVKRNAMFSLGGGCTSGARIAHFNGGRRESLSSGTPSDDSGSSVGATHFELNQYPFFWKDHNVQALIRIRPFNTNERVQGYGRCIRQENAQTLVWLGHPETRFTFDHVACETISQEKLVTVVGLPMVENCMSGYNSCMFAYGQTGSGKTYTMMGDICEAEDKLNEHCGITPRLFEYLFSRIRMEENDRMDEKLKFSCKCSFLEIYNEQITDLLEPSSSNLQLREDSVKGVHVENLSEYLVGNVNDVLKLLLQGATNRKMAATRMNSESSRSHSVFTCIIESRWEKDSLNHFRFARLNLVDLAGSERQKSSGAEGDRLKEAANINKSLSTLGVIIEQWCQTLCMKQLGDTWEVWKQKLNAILCILSNNFTPNISTNLVIMSLVDLAHGKHRHVPYRDSRLTFLLQDSLGGNSKTMIIANVSPSICSANETLSTLKFAQRAKLIQNNAKVNEDASGDVTALQREIQQLKNEGVSRSMSPGSQGLELNLDHYSGRHERQGIRVTDDQNHHIQSIGIKRIRRTEATLAGALRREKVAETAIHKAEAEIEQMSRLARQREDDAQGSRMILRFREEKIKQLEMLVSGSLSAEKYLMEENKALKEEIQLLQARIDRNPELTRFALENIRLLEQLQLFQNFYGQGEREKLLAEISELNNQLLEMFESKNNFSSGYETQNNGTAKELEDYQSMNSKLIREVDELRMELQKHLNCDQAAVYSVTDSISKDPEEFRQADKYSLVETMSIRTDSEDERENFVQANNGIPEIQKEKNIDDPSVIQLSDSRRELKEARLLIDAMQYEQVALINELQLIQEENATYKEMLSNKEIEEKESELKQETRCMELNDAEERDRVQQTNNSPDMNILLQRKLEKLSKDLEEARLLNWQYQDDHASRLSHEHEVNLVREQVETETARTILQLQEEVAALQSELQENLCCMTRENERLKTTVTAIEVEKRSVSREWEKATLELTSFLIDGSRSIKDASNQIDSIICSFPRVNAWMSEHVEKAAKVCIEKEETILLLQKSLGDAQKMVSEMELRLSSLKGATIGFYDIHQQDNERSTEKAIQLQMLLNEKINMAKMLESQNRLLEDQIIDAEKRSKAAFLVVKWISDSKRTSENEYTNGDPRNSTMATPVADGMSMKSCENTLALPDCKAHIELALLELLECENAISTLSASFQTDFHLVYSECKDFVQHVIREVRAMQCKFFALKNCEDVQVCSVELQPNEAIKCLEFENQDDLLHGIKNELVAMNARLGFIKDCFNEKPQSRACSSRDEADGTSDDCSTSESDYSIGSVDLGTDLDTLPFTCFSEETFKQVLDTGSQGDSTEDSSVHVLGVTRKIEAMPSGLRKELDMAFVAFNKLHVQLTTYLNENNRRNCSFKEDMNQIDPSLMLVTEAAKTECLSLSEVADCQKIDHARSFFSKFHEARATMKEADIMLKEFVEANENAKQLNAKWCQTGEDLLAERGSLIKELEQLKSSMALCEEDNLSLKSQLYSNVMDMMNSMSWLEEYFVQMKSEVEDSLEALFSDVLSMGREMHKLVWSSRSTIEHMYSDVIEKGFALFILLQCHKEKFINQMHNPSKDFSSELSKQQQKHSRNNIRAVCLSGQPELIDIGGDGGTNWEDRSEGVISSDAEGKQSQKSLIHENLSLKKELKRKEDVLEGLLFDLTLLQESASQKKDIEDETDKLIQDLSQLREELKMKTSQVDDLLVNQRKHENKLADTEHALVLSNSDLEQARDMIDTLSYQSDELRGHLNDLYIKKAEAEEELEEQKEIVKGLENEVLSLTSSREKEASSSVIREDLREVTRERDELLEDICSLNKRLEMVYALADEKEAIAAETCQELEASKIYAEQKEEEVKILEHSVEELECTINVLETKVYEMDKEVERHRLTRESLELQLQTLRQRLSKVENFTDIVDACSNAEQAEYKILSFVASPKAKQIEFLTKERAELNKEVKHCKEYISELLLHSEAQALQYQQKYKSLEKMVRGVKLDSSSSSAAPTLTSEKLSTRTRGSNSPFRCIAGLVQQMSVEKDQELSAARLRIEEQEKLLANQQKEVCKLNTRLAAAESMTHDVIRDLLGVKLDMTNYADMIDQYEIQNLVEKGHQHTEEIQSKDQEILNLKTRINELAEERESCISDITKKDADILIAQISLEKLKERGQMLSAQNEMLKRDKTNSLKRVAELDQMVKVLLETQASDQQTRQSSKMKENASLRHYEKLSDQTKRYMHSEKPHPRVDYECPQYLNSSSSQPSTQINGHSSKTRYRR